MTKKIKLRMANIELRDAVFNSESYFYWKAEQEDTPWTNADVADHFKRMIAAMNQATDNEEIYAIGDSFCNKDNYELEDEVITLIIHLQIIATGEISPDYLPAPYPRCLKKHVLPSTEAGQQMELFKNPNPDNGCRDENY